MRRWCRRNLTVIQGYFLSVFGIIESAAKKGNRIDFAEKAVRCKRSLPLCLFKRGKAGCFAYIMRDASQSSPGYLTS